MPRRGYRHKPGVSATKERSPGIADPTHMRPGRGAGNTGTDAPHHPHPVRGAHPHFLNSRGCSRSSFAPGYLRCPRPGTGK